MSWWFRVGFQPTPVNWFSRDLKYIEKSENSQKFILTEWMKDVFSESRTKEIETYFNSQEFWGLGGITKYKEFIKVLSEYFDLMTQENA